VLDRAPVDGMQKVRGSNPLSSTQFWKLLRSAGAERGASAYLGAFLVSEDGVHRGCAHADHGLELMPVDLLGHDGGAVAREVGDLLNGDFGRGAALLRRDGSRG
jgi:hypothetical protein